MQWVLKFLSALFVIGIFVYSADVAAQLDPVADEPMEAKGVGISGGAIAGAEVVLLIESIAKVKPTWAWWVFPILGAGGGAVGGYYLEKKSAGGAVALLVAAMAGAIPTAVAVATARSYDPSSESGTDGTNKGEVYSFEMEPVGAAEDEETVTEVEARPDGVPDDSAGPPAPVAPPPPQEAPAEEVPEVEETPEAEEPQSALELEHQSKMAHLTSGSLIHMDRRRDVGFGVPMFDVAPVAIQTADMYSPVLSGVEFRLPLFSVDLP